MFGVSPRVSEITRETASEFDDRYSDEDYDARTGRPVRGGARYPRRRGARG